MLEREEYVEQAYLFRMIGERLPDNVPLQEILEHAKQEILATTKLPHAIDFLAAELKHSGGMAPAMTRLAHYFAPFQTYVVREAESEKGRLDIRTAVEILRSESDYRARFRGPQGLFMFQFECLCRNRLKYDPGLGAMALDPAYDDAWREWILLVRSQIGLVDLADLIFVRSAEYARRRALAEEALPDVPPSKAVLFGEKEGKIAWAHRGKDPLYFFASLQRHLDYPAVPRLKQHDDSQEQLPLLIRRLERLETRMKLLEEENKQAGLDITKFYGDKPPEFPS